MKKIYMLLFFLMTASVLFAQKEILVLHTNDMHSRIEPFATSHVDTMLAGKGGMVRRANFIAQQRKEHKNVLLFDSGDFCQGTPYYNMYKGEVEVQMMNAMKYDAATIGNHEFDFGLENMARLFKMAKFPIVCANYGVEGTMLEGLVKEYVVLERDGVRIGVFGLSPKMLGLVSRAKFADVKMKDPIEEAQRVVDILRNVELCDMVVCLSHLGWNSGTDNDVKLIQHTRGIDIVCGGHSHTFFEKPQAVKNLDGQDVYVSQMGKHAAFVGYMNVNLEKK